MTSLIGNSDLLGLMRIILAEKGDRAKLMWWVRSTVYMSFVEFIKKYLIGA